MFKFILGKKTALKPAIAILAFALAISPNSYSQGQEKVVGPRKVAEVSPTENQAQYEVTENQGSGPAVKPSKVTHPSEVKAVSSRTVQSVDVPSEVALRNAYQDEQNAIKAKQQAEYENVAAQAEFQKKKAHTEQQVSAKQRKIYTLQQKEQMYLEEVDRMKFELGQMEERMKIIQKDVDSAQEREKLNYSKYSEAKSALDQTKGTLASTTESLKKTREETGRKISNYQIEMQKIRGQIATYEADIARAENDRTRAEAEELQTRTQWASLTAQLMSLKEERDQAYAQLADTKTQLDNARTQYQALKSESVQTEKEKQMAESDANKKKAELTAELRKLETDTALAHNQKAGADAEMARIAVEIEKLQVNLTYAKKRHEDAQNNWQASDNGLRDSRLAYETAKADLARELAAMETLKLRRDANFVRSRGIASVSGAAVLEGQKSWVVSKTCSITRGPASSDSPAGKINAGDKLIAAPAVNGYVKILSASGRATYAPADCGQFGE